MKMVRVGNDDFMDGFLQLPGLGVPNKAITSWHNPSTTYRLRITGVIGSIESLADEIEVLENAKENDLIIMQICSPGGDLDTGDFFGRRMKECEAPIIAEIGMTCASAASTIALNADDWVIADSSTMMVHSCSWSPGWGKESDIRYSTEFTERLNREFVRRTYENFLTEAEFEQVLRYGQDLYFFADELMERLKKYGESRQKAEENDAQFEIELDN